MFFLNHARTPIKSFVIKYDDLILRDEDLRDKCQFKCENDYVYCTLNCSGTNCLLDCGRELNECVSGTLINQIGTFILDGVLLISKAVHAIKIVQMVVMVVLILSVRAETIRIPITKTN